jgi:V-type H+-transporting ATPase subunit E
MMLMQGMYSLMDRELFIRCRKEDTELVEKAAKEAAETFEKEAGFPVETEIDSDSPLPSERYAVPRRLG